MISNMYIGLKSMFSSACSSPIDHFSRLEISGMRGNTEEEEEEEPDEDIEK